MSVIVKSGGGKPEEEKTVTAGTSVIEVSPSSGKVMKKVTVNPTPTENKEVTAGTEDITVSPIDGKYFSGVTIHPTPSQERTVIPTADGFKVSPEIGKLLSAVFVDGDSDLVAGNIKKGINIFGVDGSFDNSNGAYVWKKSKKYIISFTQEGTTGVYQCTSDDIDLSTVDDNWFVGTSGVITTSSNTPYEFKENNVFKGTSSGLTYSYNPTTQKMTISYASAGTRTMSDGVNKIFIDYVVSDDSSAYPDGAEQDGYWYEKVVEGISGIDYGTVTLTAQTKTITFAHSLKTVPTRAIVVPIDYASVGNKLIVAYMTTSPYDGNVYGFPAVLASNTGMVTSKNMVVGSANIGSYFTATNATVKVTGTTEFCKGTYLVIAVA